MGTCVAHLRSTQYGVGEFQGPRPTATPGEGGPVEPLSQPPSSPPPSNEAPGAGPTTSTAGRLKSLKHVISHMNLANPVHHPFFFWYWSPACFPDPPPPLTHTGSKGPPPPELQWTVGPTGLAAPDGRPGPHRPHANAPSAPSSARLPHGPFATAVLATDAWRVFRPGLCLVGAGVWG